MSYLVQLTCTLREGVKEEFIANWLGENGAKVARGSDGNRGVSLAWGRDDPEHQCIIQQRWLTPAHAQAYFKMRAEGNGAEWKAKFFVENPAVSHWRLDPAL